MYDPLELTERSSDAAFVIDGASCILGWNAQAETLLGISSREAINQTCYGLLDGVTETGQSICGPRCAAAGCFQADAPFLHGCMFAKGPGSTRVPLQVSTIVLPGSLERGTPKAIIFLRPLGVPPQAISTETITLHIFTLGRFRLRLGSRDLDWRSWPRRQAVALLKILVSRRGRPVHRDALIEALWPGLDPNDGMKRLKVVVHSLRRSLEPHLKTSGSSTFVVTEGECYCLPNGAHLWVDADRFRDLMLAGDKALQDSRRQDGLALYREAKAQYLGDFLEQDMYNDWIAPERERLQEMYLSLLVKLASLHAGAGLLPEAVEACQAAIAIDPCRESVYRLLIAYLWKAGRRGEALQQFYVCKEVLRRELGVEPMPETLELYKHLMENLRAPASTR